MRRVRALNVVLLAMLLGSSMAFAQTTQPGDTVDVEIYNPVDGSNRFCVASSTIFEARVFFRPGTDTIICDLSCSPDPPGGSANIATAVIDLVFDGNDLNYVPASITNNVATAAIQGLAQEQNIADDRIGWALAGSWSTPGNPGSSLDSPCAMDLITAADWLFAVQFQAVGSGMTTVRLRRETDVEPFALSFADICGTEAFKESNGGIDEVRDAVVMIAGDCSDVLFFDNFGSGSADQWSAVSE